eukprot:scaffold15318_cov98-Cylindrotheca_fusiformis.AAC.2
MSTTTSEETNSLSTSSWLLPSMVMPVEMIFQHGTEIGAIMFVLFGTIISIAAGDAGLFAAQIWFLGLPLGLLVVHYLWLRLCRDPFLSPSDSFLRIFWESATTCPPDMRRTVPTIVFVILIAVVATGSLIARLGEKDAAKNWWWKNNLRRMDEERQKNEMSPEGMELTSLVTKSNENDDTIVTKPNEIDDTNAKSSELDQGRRSAKLRAVLILLTYLWWTTWSFLAGYNPHTLELSIPLPRLPPQCDGYRLAVATDLHAGALSGHKDTEWMVQHLNSLNPDAIALAGDVGDEHVDDVLKKKLEPLAQLNAPDGVYYSFGNHENMNGIEDFRKLFRTESPFKETIVTLENEHAIITPSGSGEDCRIAMVGMADWSGNDPRPFKGQIAPDFQKAIHSTPGPNGTTVELDTPVSASLPMIMLQHEPANMKNAAKDGVGLQLSGHTHGGQLWPQHVLLTNFDAISGLHEFDVGSKDGPSYLWVSEGVVGWGPRLRFLCKTDIALLTLRNPEAMAAEGLVPDTHMTVSTFGMYLSLVLIPLGLLAFLIPAICWTKKRIQDRRSTESEDDDVGAKGTGKIAKFNLV